jgi:hypothetical protein
MAYSTHMVDLLDEQFVTMKFEKICININLKGRNLLNWEDR